MSSVRLAPLVAALVTSPLPLADLTAADVASRAAADGALMEQAVRRAHWLIDAALTTPPAGPKGELAVELDRLLDGLDGAQAWWGGVPSEAAGVQADKARALHCAGRVALWSLLIAGADALHDVGGTAPADAAVSAISAAGRDPALLHQLGPLRKQWREIRPGLRERRDDRGRGLGWIVPYVERGLRDLGELRTRPIGRKLPTAPLQATRIRPGDGRLAEWPAGATTPHHDVVLTGKDARALLRLAEPGDVILATRRQYAGLAQDPVAAVVLGAWDDLDSHWRRDRAAGRFLEERGVVNRKPRLYMHLRFPSVAKAWEELSAPAAVAVGGAGAALIPLEDALRADTVQLLRPKTTSTMKLRAVALAAHHVGWRLSSQALVQGCFGPGDGMAGVAVAPLSELSGAPAWELVAARPADR